MSASVMICVHARSLASAVGSAARQRVAWTTPSDDVSRSSSASISASPIAPSRASRSSHQPAQIRVHRETFGYAVAREPALEQLDVVAEPRHATGRRELQARTGRRGLEPGGERVGQLAAVRLVRQVDTEQVGVGPAEHRADRDVAGLGRQQPEHVRRTRASDRARRRRPSPAGCSERRPASRRPRSSAAPTAGSPGSSASSRILAQVSSPASGITTATDGSRATSTSSASSSTSTVVPRPSASYPPTVSLCGRDAG